MGSGDQAPGSRPAGTKNAGRMTHMTRMTGRTGRTHLTGMAGVRGTSGLSGAIGRGGAGNRAAWLGRWSGTGFGTMNSGRGALERPAGRYGMSADVVRMMCPNLKCRAVLSVPGHARGKTVRCRQCGARVRIPPEKTLQIAPILPPGGSPNDAAEPKA